MKHPTVALLGVGMLGCAAALPAGQLANTAQDDPVPAAAQSMAPAANPFLGGTGFPGFAPPLDNGGTNGQGMVQPGYSPGMPDVGTGFNVDDFSSAFLEGGALPSPTLAVDSVAGPAATSTTTPSDYTVASATLKAAPNASSTTSAE